MIKILNKIMKFSALKHCVGLKSDDFVKLIYPKTSLTILDRGPPILKVITEETKTI